MRIRDHLIALATAALAPSRAQARGPVADGPPVPIGDEPTEPVSVRPELSRQLGEQLLQSITASRQRLILTAEALAILGNALAATEQAIRELLERRAPQPLTALALALAAANTRTPDGAFLFAGTTDLPFAADGAYRGPSSAGVIVVIPGPPPCLAVPAAALTCLAPTPSTVDILPRLARAHTACLTATPRTLETCREPLAAAAAQITYLQSRVDAALTVLSEALPLTSELLPSRLPLSLELLDPSLLAQAFSDLEAARSLAERALAIFPATA